MYLFDLKMYQITLIPGHCRGQGGAILYYQVQETGWNLGVGLMSSRPVTVAGVVAHIPKICLGKTVLGGVTHRIFVFAQR